MSQCLRWSSTSLSLNISSSSDSLGRCGLVVGGEGVSGVSGSYTNMGGGDLGSGGGEDSGEGGCEDGSNGKGVGGCDVGGVGGSSVGGCESGGVGGSDVGGVGGCDGGSNMGGMCRVGKSDEIGLVGEELVCVPCESLGHSSLYGDKFSRGESKSLRESVNSQLEDVEESSSNLGNESCFIET